MRFSLLFGKITCWPCSSLISISVFQSYLLLPVKGHPAHGMDYLNYALAGADPIIMAEQCINGDRSEMDSYRLFVQELCSAMIKTLDSYNLDPSDYFDYQYL